MNGALIVGDSTLVSPVVSQFEIGGTGSSIVGTFALDYTSLGLGDGLYASFDNGTGVLSIVPEPSRALLLMLGLMGVVVRRRRS